MTKGNWSLGPENGELRVLTGVVGPAAKMGHRLTIAMGSWQAAVRWRAGKPSAVDLTVDVDSLQVLKGEGGVAGLSSPEKTLVRSNALKSLDARGYPRIRFAADSVEAVQDGYRLIGTLEIHGTTRPQTVDLVVQDGGADWVMSATSAVRQSDFGVKPYSLMMGTLKVADEVTVAFTATHPK